MHKIERLVREMTVSMLSFNMSPLTSIAAGFHAIDRRREPVERERGWVDRLRRSFRWRLAFYRVAT